MPRHDRKITREQRVFLEGVFPGDVLFAPEETLVFATDAGRLAPACPPLAVVRPRTAASVQELMRWADAERMPLYIRGRGTNLVGDCIPEPAGIVVSTTYMDAILDISEEDFVAEVEPGVNTEIFQARCEAKNLFYPPDPASQKATSLGGNVATAAGGMRALKYGVTRDFVLGMDLIVPGGEILTFGGRTHKNVVGLDIPRLVTGSEGTLGFISRLVMKLLPKPEATASLLAGFSSLAEAMNAVTGVFRAGILPTALEFMGETVLFCMRSLAPVPWPQEIKTCLLFRLDGSAETLPLELERLTRALPAGTWNLRGVGKDEEEPLWEIRRRINPSAFVLGPDKILDDVTVPRGSILHAVNAIDAIAREHDTKLLTFGHVGDGNIHVNLMYDAENPAEYERAKATKLAVNKAVIALGGTMSGEHGIGSVKDIRLQMGDAELALMRRVKTAFDPNNILNPGKGY